jgi:undecaprenyl pyrophosphate synthase
MALNSSSAPALPELTGLGEAELLQVIRSHPLPTIFRAADTLGLRDPALYAFSAENWTRPEDEVATLRVHATQHNSGLDPMTAFNDGGREELLAYTELWVTPTLWPDFAPLELDRALADFQGRTRRFGGV